MKELMSKSFSRSGRYFEIATGAFWSKRIWSFHHLRRLPEEPDMGFPFSGMMP